jgi:hypothetical protein
LKEAITLKNVEYIEYGEIIQTTAIFSIVICAPLSAILINTMGPILLTKDSIDETDMKKSPSIVVEEVKGGSQNNEE